MSSMIETWTAVEGHVRSISPAADTPGFVNVVMDATHSQDVPGFANVIGDVKGRTLELRVPESAAASAGIKEGDKVAMQVKRSGPPNVPIYANPNTVVKR